MSISLCGMIVMVELLAERIALCVAVALLSVVHLVEIGPAAADAVRIRDFVIVGHFADGLFAELHGVLVFGYEPHGLGASLISSQSP